jgi:murein DD-endopeptidase MepM/ murein hydrolase activator NlpD
MTSTPKIGPGTYRRGGPLDVWGHGYIDFGAYGTWVISSPFHGAEDYRFQPHSGIDLIKVSLAADGVTVEYETWGTELPNWFGPSKVTTVALNYNSYGWYVWLDDDDSGYFAIFAHMNGAPPVRSGLHVARGQTVGRMGNTGFVFSAGVKVPQPPPANNHDGSHVHFAVQHPTGRYVNPLTFLVPNIDDRTDPIGNWEPTYGEAIRLLNRAFTLDPNYERAPGGLGYEVEAEIEENRKWIKISERRR